MMAKERERRPADGLAIRGILENLSETEQKLISAVIAAERNKLYMKKPHGIIDDLEQALKELIK
jgi:hypothetical protein